MELSQSNQELAARIRISRVIYAARKSSGLGQSELAEKLFISQSALSKIESEILVPSMMVWFQFCRLFNLPADETFETGYIDRGIAHKVTNEPVAGTFRLPKRYAHERGSTARSCLPFLQFFESVHGREKLASYLKSLKISDKYFVVLDHTINIQFLLDLVSMLIQEGSLDKNQLRALTQQVSQPICHGKLHWDYDRAEDTQSLLRALITNAPKYSANFSYQIENENGSNMDLSVTPLEHMARFDYRSKNLGSFICDYHKEYLTQFSAYHGAPSVTPSVTIDEQQCHFKGADRCVYRIHIAS